MSYEDVKAYPFIIGRSQNSWTAESEFENLLTYRCRPNRLNSHLRVTFTKNGKPFLIHRHY